jgi:NAD(P)-dependent dehydrogenase (short-subunit alcohol dehydrogenase family)
VMMQVQTNFLGTVFCCQAAIPLLRGADNPRIINISSASAWHYDEMSHLSIYAATKAAVERFTRDLRLELQVDGIGVTCIRPGGAWTSFADGWEGDAFSAGLEAWKDTGTYMDTGMDVAQVGDAVAYAMSQPAGVAVDLLEIRPNVPTAKGSF